MNEWDLQSELTEQWLFKPPEIHPLGRLDLIAWELMFPSWDINYKATRWSEPSLDFVFLSESGSFVLVELKNQIPNRSAFLSAFCQVSHRAIQFAHTYNKELMLKAFGHCMKGACQRFVTDSASRQYISERIQQLPDKVHEADIYRVIAAVRFPKTHEALLTLFNAFSFSELTTLIGFPPKSAKERLRFCELRDSYYNAIRANPVFLYQVFPSNPISD